ncbi:eIF-3 zeta [Cavenderia fasciculata]|uniref:Eukaryotic translation initiation factor 3 subunit D n=1 Tax=Cavenderia fasciculata TaxID=261658 RepID=F4Q8N0_CACFS|nr:eIF-3 zeta [Cavenderia fasciculata]EGG15049.1 eIF-3 zeta [Cavenderia fasciculata]|eukprot:XP_004351769.1 eIF-3 zeta [Cavenderia fasciculata]
MSFTFDISSIKSNPDGWGPTGSVEKFNDIPYAPFSKSEKIGKCSDWNSNMKIYQRQNIYGANASNPFTYKLEDDEDSFQLVDYSRPVSKTSYGHRGGSNRGKLGGNRGGFYQNRQGGRVILPRQGGGGGGHRGGKQGGRYGNRYHWNDRRQKSRESSVQIDQTWEMKEELDLAALKQYVIEVNPVAELVATCGNVKFYNRSIEKVSARDEKTLQKNDKMLPLIQTSDDKIIRKNFTQGNVYATDAILATLMTANRSVYSWDIVVVRVAGKIFFEHRPGMSDVLTVNENASHHHDDKDPINAPSALSSEASVINQNYWQQVLDHQAEPIKFDSQLDEEDLENCVEVGYRYYKWNLGDDITVMARTEVDGLMPGSTAANPKFVAIKATNEYDPMRDQSTDFRKNIDQQRASVLATEMKNNSNKFAKWSIQATLAGCDQVALGYVSRNNPNDPTNHVILASHIVTTASLNQQNRVDMRNNWGILKRIIQSCQKLPNGKYLLHRDPNRAVINIYSVPEDAFDPEEEELLDEEEDQQNKGWVENDSR